jgi:hypothetical protein
MNSGAKANHLGWKTTGEVTVMMMIDEDDWGGGLQ